MNTKLSLMLALGVSLFATSFAAEAQTMVDGRSAGPLTEVAEKKPVQEPVKE